MWLQTRVDSVAPLPPRNFKRRWRYLSIWLLFILGSGVTFARFSYIRGRDQEIESNEFNLRSTNYVSSFTREMEGLLSSIESLAEFVELENNLDRNNFEPFAAREIQIHPAILALEWLPHVSQAGREAYERTLSKSEGREISITFGSTSAPQPSPEKIDYFPITLMYPRTAAEKVLGFNGYSQKELHAILDRARDTGEVTAAAKFHLVEQTTGGFAAPFYFPIYREPTANRTVDDRRRTLAGYVLGIVEISAALEHAIKQISEGQVNLQFADLSAAPGKQLLHFHRAPGEAATVQPLSDAAALTPASMKFIRQFPIAGRQWAVVCTPTAQYLRATTSWRPLALLAIGMLGTISLCTYFLLHLNYTARAEGLVGQLFQNNSRLNAEIEERKKAEKEISRLNTSLEERVAERTEALRESEERYALAARGSKDGLWDWNLVSGTVYFSQRWKNMLGFGEEEISDSPDEWFNRMHTEDAGRVNEQIKSYCAGETAHFQSEYRMLHKDGSYRWMLSRGVAVRDERGRTTRIAGSQTDVTEDKVADPLTGLPNRLFLGEKLQQAIQRARDSRSHLFAILFLDLDRFKIVNDSLGHKAGDLLLRAIAARLHSCCVPSSNRPGKTVIARLGGDEFAVLLDEIANSRVATDFAAAIKSAMNPAFDLDGRQVFATCSIGVALGGPESEPNDLLRDADIAMYHAKAQGKHRFEVFDAAMRQRAMDRMQLETDLRAAVPRGELDINYQPKISLVDGSIVEFEALVRWNHPVRGLVMPQSFVPLADETGIILSIGEWVLFQACRQLAAWQKRFGTHVGVSVNISARQFETAELVNQVRCILAETGLQPSSLSLEITESLLLGNPESAIRQLNELRAIGIGLKIDDFGTGFSSLSYLHRLPFNELKIDRSFICTFGNKTEATHIVHTIILLARLLDMKVVAEGVETEEQLNALTALSCDYAQGNFFAKPLPADKAEIFLGEDCSPFFRYPGAANAVMAEAR
jgi:diguanylate cyclase (GGDEF)-like protein/PAS domain S-box-containing protein